MAGGGGSHLSGNPDIYLETLISTNDRSTDYAWGGWERDDTRCTYLREFPLLQVGGSEIKSTLFSLFGSCLVFASHLTAAVTFGANTAPAVRVVYERCVGGNLTCISQLGESSPLLPCLGNPISLQRPPCAPEPGHTSHLQEAQRPSTLVLPRAKRFCCRGYRKAGRDSFWGGRPSVEGALRSCLGGPHGPGSQVQPESSLQTQRRRTGPRECGREHLSKSWKKGSWASTPPPSSPLPISVLEAPGGAVALSPGSARLTCSSANYPRLLALPSVVWRWKDGEGGLDISRGAIWG